MSEKTDKENKIRELFDILDSRGLFDKLEKSAVTTILGLNYLRFKTREDILEAISGVLNISTQLVSFGDCRILSAIGRLEEYNRHLVYFLNNPQFQERVMHYCLDYLIPYLSERDIWEIIKKSR